jgi:hypothetical protein
LMSACRRICCTSASVIAGSLAMRVAAVWLLYAKPAGNALRVAISRDSLSGADSRCASLVVLRFDRLGAMRIGSQTAGV